MSNDKIINFKNLEIQERAEASYAFVNVGSTIQEGAQDVLEFMKQHNLSSIRFVFNEEVIKVTRNHTAKDIANIYQISLEENEKARKAKEDRIKAYEISKGINVEQ